MEDFELYPKGHKFTINNLSQFGTAENITYSYFNFQDALLQHIKRAIYQADIWSSSTQAMPEIPSPTEFSWVKVNCLWKRIWMSIPQVSNVCRELIKCTCKCVKDNLACTQLC